jgi:hypothetical protein
MTDQAPLVKEVTETVPAVAAGADDGNHLARAPFAGEVTAVTYTPDATLTGANTDSRTISLVNRGAGGAGTTVVASKAFTAGVNATDNDETAITLSVVADATDVAEGDILEWVSTHVGGTGLADPGGMAKVQFTRS